jgi:hypothetical protein
MNIKIFVNIIITNKFIIMFWRSLLISFVLNNKRNLLNYNHTNLKLSYLDSIADSLPSENVHQKPIIQENINNLIQKKHFFFNLLNNGYDYRKTNDDELIEKEEERKIYLIYNKMLLLSYLESDIISQSKKLDLIELFNTDSNSSSKYVPNINSGNLFSDW